MITELMLAASLFVQQPDTARHHSRLSNIVHVVRSWAPLAFSAAALGVVLAYPRPHQLVCKMTMTVVPPVQGQPYGAEAVSTCQ